MGNNIFWIVRIFPITGRVVGWFLDRDGDVTMAIEGVNCVDGWRSIL